MITPGAAESAVILHVPHASTTIPDDVRAGIVLDDDQLAAELWTMTDAYTDVIALEAAERCVGRPWVVVNPLSRLVVDPERFPDHTEEMNAVGMGVVYTRTSSLQPFRDISSGETLRLVDRYFHPYADAMRNLVENRVAACGQAVIIDLHSYPSRPLPYELHQDQQRPPLCLGTDPFHTPISMIAAAVQAWQHLGSVVENEPFAGAYVPLDRYQHDDRVTAIMLELRRDTYLDESEPDRPPTLGPVVEALTDFLAAIGGIGHPGRR